MDTLKTQKADLEKRLSEHDAKNSETSTKVRIRALPHLNPLKRSPLQVATYEENMRKLRNMNNNLKQQLGASNGEKSTLNRTLADLQAELKSVVVERDSLRANTGNGAEVSKEVTSQLESLRQEKIALEKALADEKASKAVAAQTAPSPDQSSVIVRSYILCSIRAL